MLNRLVRYFEKKNLRLVECYDPTNNTCRIFALKPDAVNGDYVEKGLFSFIIFFNFDLPLPKFFLWSIEYLNFYSHLFQFLGNGCNEDDGLIDALQNVAARFEEARPKGGRSGSQAPSVKFGP